MKEQAAAGKRPAEEEEDADEIEERAKRLRGDFSGSSFMPNRV